MKNLINEHKMGVGFLLSLCLLFSFSLVTAATDTSDVNDVFQVNEQISYNKPCVNNGTYCSAATTCNYTFYNIDNSIKFNNVPATNVGDNGGSIWQYNVTNTETGLYKVDMVCLDGTSKGSETLYYEVTGDGSNDNFPFFIAILLLSFGIIIFGFSIKDPTTTILGSFGLYLVSIYILFNGIAGVKDATYTWAIGLIVLGLAMYISTRSAYELIVD